MQAMQVSKLCSDRHKLSAWQTYRLHQIGSMDSIAKIPATQGPAPVAGSSAPHMPTPPSAYICATTQTGSSGLWPEPAADNEDDQATLAWEFAAVQCSQPESSPPALQDIYLQGGTTQRTNIY